MTYNPSAMTNFTYKKDEKILQKQGHWLSVWTVRLIYALFFTFNNRTFILIFFQEFFMTFWLGYTWIFFNVQGRA